MRPIILKVYLSNNTQTVSEVPITPETTCRDVIDCCKEPGEEHCHLAELWRGCERPIGEQERPYEILQQWGIHRDEVKFYLRHEPAVPLGQRTRRKNGMKEPESLPEATLSGGVDLTLTELQEMAARQQQQIETQQQMLVAKEQRLKYLKQQELKHQQIASENERLHKLRLRVEEQELKLRKLRALRGQVDQQKINNSSLTSELESIRALFNEKEKELAMAVSKVEELTKQLEEIRRGRLNGLSCDPSHTYSATIELEKLHRELIIRNKMNEQQNSKLNAHREVLSHRQEEMARMDKRIAELTERLRRKRSLNEQLSNQINNSNKPVQLRNNSNNSNPNNSTNSRIRPLSANVAAVEPYKHTPKEVILDDIHTKLITNEDLPEFSPHKKDPKYQTLPYNTKFSVSEAKKVRVDSIEDLKECSKTVDSAEKDVDTEKIYFSNDKPRSSPPSNVKPLLTTQIVHSTSNHPSNKSPNTASIDSNKTINRESLQPSKNTINHFVPKPYGSTYSSSILPPNNFTSLRGQPEGNNGSTSSQSSKILSNNVQSSTSNNNSSSSTSRNAAGAHSMMSFHDNKFPNRTEAWSSSSKFSRPIVTVASSTPPISNVQPQVRSSPIFQTSSSRVLSPLLLNHKDHDGSGPPPLANLVPSANSSKNNISPVSSSSESTPKPLLSSHKDSSYSPSSNSLSSEGSNASMPSPNSSNEDIPKPTLPPRPSAPIKPTPPPRLTRMHSQDEVEQVKKIDTSQKALDSAMSILRGNSSSSNTNSGPQTNGINPPSYKFAPKTLVANAYSRRLGSTTQDQYRRIMDQLYNSTPAKQDDSESSGKNSSNDQLSHKNRLDHDRPLDISPPPYSSLSSSQQERPSPENEKGQVNNDQSVKAKLPLYKKPNNSDNSKLLRSGPPSPKKQLPETTRPHSNSQNGNSRSDKSYSENPNIHISINRRIEMPPDFLLPEMTPPDISSGVRDNYNNNNNNNNKNNTSESQNYDNRYITPPRYSGSLQPLPSYQETEENHSKTTKLKKHQTDTENNSTSYEVQENGDISTPSPIIYPQNQQERNGHSPPKQLENKDEVDYTNKSQLSPSHQNSGQNNINGQFHALGNSGKQSASYMAIRRKKGNLKTKDSIKNTRRVSFDPLALLLDASLEGELELVMKTAQEVPNPSAANDEGITALHNAICAGHFEIVKFLVEFGCDVNAQDSDGWTPLHCAASCNNVPMVKFLVEHGACIFATTLSDQETAAEKCEEDEEGFDGCSEYLYSVQEKLGIVNNGAVYAVYDYDAQNPDELNFKDGDMMIVLRKGDEFEREWWWARLKDREGYIPRNLLGLYPRVLSRKDS